VLVV
jgi:hypothetical protein